LIVHLQELQFLIILEQLIFLRLHFQ